MSLDGMSKDDLICLLKQVVSEAVESHPLSNEEIEWVRLAIKAEAQRAEFRKAVIEKTFIGLMGSGGIAAFYWAVDFIKLHWK